LYEFALLGSPSHPQIRQLKKHIGDAVSRFGLKLGKEVTWTVSPSEFNPKNTKSAAIAFFGTKAAPEANLNELLDKSIPVIPVVSDASNVHKELPECLWSLNCLMLSDVGLERVSTALLECAGLLPHQRRVFLSYRRSEAREAALQLFDELSARCFDVFLDTHGVAPADDFQAVLWHRLCDSDVLVMLDTPTYFASRWTSAEFGRALAKGISVLRKGWPDSTPSVRLARLNTLSANSYRQSCGATAKGGQLSNGAFVSNGNKTNMSTA
jgi:hypothetical protein